jgi:hypothetical protein
VQPGHFEPGQVRQVQCRQRETFALLANLRSRIFNRQHRVGTPIGRAYVGLGDIAGCGGVKHALLDGSATLGSDRGRIALPSYIVRNGNERLKLLAVLREAGKQILRAEPVRVQQAVVERILYGRSFHDGCEL